MHGKKMTAFHTGELRTMREKISIEIQRGNAVSVLGTVEQLTTFYSTGKPS